jgi:pimeloyl-ACP methyl ester carboxylesterase
MGTAAPKLEKPNVVLVHGGFADGSGWEGVYRILKGSGCTVAVVQNPTLSLEDDVAVTKRAIAAQDGPVVLVGHSYGGAVVTEAGNDANVAGLVYIAAFAPDAGEPIGAFGEKYPSALGPALRPDAAGFVIVDPAQFQDLFAADVSDSEASVMAAAQKPINGSAFGASVEQAAWKTIPSWYLVAQEDRAINPELERFYARRMGATTTEIKASHVPFISHPDEVARLIEQAGSEAVK